MTRTVSTAGSRRWARAGGAPRCSAWRGRGGDAAGGAEGCGHAAPPRPRGLAAAVPLLGGHVDADLDGLPLLQSQVQLLGGSLLLLLDLLLCQQTLEVVVESCLKIKTIRSVFKAEPKKNTFPLFCYFYDEISAGVCDALDGEAGVGLYWHLFEQNIRIFVLQLDLGPLAHGHQPHFSIPGGLLEIPVVSFPASCFGLGRNFVHQTRLLEQQRPLWRSILRRLLAGLLVPPC